MMAAPGTSQSPRIARSYSASPWPGPSTLKVATPRSRKSSSVERSSSFVESSPGIIRITGCGPGPAGWRKMPTSCDPSNGISIRWPGGSR